MPQGWIKKDHREMPRFPREMAFKMCCKQSK